MAVRKTEKEWEEHNFPLEAKLQDFVLRRIKEYRNINGNHVFAFKIADRYTTGISDLLLCVCGQFVAIELKVGKNTTTPLQEHFIRTVRYAGGKTKVSRNWGDVKEVVNPILKRNGKPVL